MGKRIDKQAENTAAALDKLKTASRDTEEAQGVLDRALDSLREDLDETRAKLQASEAAHDKEVSSLKEKFNEERAELKQRVATLEDRLRRVAITLDTGHEIKAK